MSMSAGTGNPILKLESVSLSLVSDAGPVSILRDVSVAIAEGSSVSIVGPSGSGKSSLLMVAAGLERPSGGRVICAGRELTGMNEDQLALFRRDNVGIVFQNFHLVPTMTALENVAIPLELAGRAEAGSHARQALAAVGLSHRLRHYPAQLSGGEQQRVALARAVVAGPKLLLADEPTGNLDEATGGLILDILFELHRERATTLVLVTHEQRLAARCERIIRLHDGQVSADEATGHGVVVRPRVTPVGA